MKFHLRTLAGAVAFALSLGSLGSVPPHDQASAAVTVTVSPNDKYAINNGIFEGWGTSLCWWANRIGYSDSLSQQAAEAFYGDDGLRLNIARFNIGGGDDPTHNHITRTDSNMPGYTVYNNGAVSYDWSADSNQRNVLRRAVEAAGDDMIVEMFSNSPPYYMTNSGCSSGGKDPSVNNLKDDSYTAFAEYLAEVCKHYENDWGIKVQSVTPTNEPYTNYWGAYSYKQEGCHFDIGESESRIILELQKSLSSRGLEHIMISGTDETAIDTQIAAFNALSPEAKNAISRIDTHTYGGSKRSELKQTAVNAGKNLWMSEVDGGSVSGTNAGEMGAGLWLAERITADCNGMNPSAWILWQVIDNHISSVGYNGNKDKGMVDVNGGYWGTAVADHDNNKIIFTKKYYTFGQYTRYIRPGMTMLNTSDSTMAAFDKENDQLVLVAYNTGGSPKDIRFDLSQFDTLGNAAQTIRTSNTENWADIGKAALSGNSLNVSLPANSVTTYIIDNVTGGISLDNKLTPVAVTGTDSWKNDAKNSADKAFDSDLSTYFDGVGGGWVQADLGDVYDITALGFCPRSGYEARSVDSYFEVSSDGLNWTKIYTIAGKPSYGMHYVKPDIIASARYVRYAVPDGAPKNEYNKDNVYCCNIAEIEIYGDISLGSQFSEIDIPAENVTGSAPWHNGSDVCNKAFDGDNETYFDGVGSGWVQADLGAWYDLAAIGYCPRKGHEDRCYMGRFEVSQDGINWTEVYTITKTPGFGMNYLRDIETEKSVRYVRYSVPENAPGSNDNYLCNIAEIKIFGDKVQDIGDVNADGDVNIADAVSLQKWLLNDSDNSVENWKAGDLCDDGRLDAFDMIMMRKMILSL